MDVKLKSALPAEFQAPDVGQAVLVHVANREKPLRAIVTGIISNAQRPAALNLQLELADKTTTTLTAVEHVSRREPFAGWERLK